MASLDDVVSLLGGAPEAPTSKYGTPPALLDRLQATESSGNPYAVNAKTGAMGPYQFMPATVAMLRQQGMKFDPFDPQQARDAADYYVQHLKQQNGGDINKALASYGGFATKDPSAYVSKVTGQGQPAPQGAVASPFDDAIGLLSGTQKLPAAAPAATKPSPATLSPQDQAIADQQAKSHAMDETLASQVTGLGSTIAAGYKGIGAFLGAGGETLLLGKGVQRAIDVGSAAASDEVRKTQNAYTYQPKTPIGQQYNAGFSSGYNPLTWAPRAGAYLGEKVGSVSPALGAAVNAGVSVFGAPALVRGASMAVPLSRALLAGKAPAPVARIEPTIGPQTPAVASDALPPAPAAPEVPAAPAAPVAPTQAFSDLQDRGIIRPPVAPAPPVQGLEQASPELQQAVAGAQAKGKAIDPVVLQRHVQADTLPVPIKLTQGQATLDPELISREMNGRGASSPLVSPEFFNEQGKALASNVDAIKAKVAPDIADADKTSMGQTLVDAYKAKDAPVLADIDAKYQALRDANGGQFPVDASQLLTNIRGALRKQLLTNDAPSSQMGEIERMAQDGSMSFEDFLSLRRNLGNIARTASDGNTRVAAGTMIEQLEALPLSAEASALKPMADAARSAARSRFDALRADPAYNAAVNDGVEPGLPSPLADSFTDRYVVRAPYANVKQLRSSLADDPNATQTVSAATIEHLRGLAKADPTTGKFLADQWNKGVQALGPKLDETLGDQAQTVRQLGDTAKLVSAQPKGSYVNNSNTLVGSISEATKSGLEGAANVAAHGVPVGTWARRAAQSFSRNKEAAKATAPGAGMTRISDLLDAGRP